MVRLPKLFLLASLLRILPSILQGSDNPNEESKSSAGSALSVNDTPAVTRATLADPFRLNLDPYVRTHLSNTIKPKGIVIDVDDLSDKDRRLWGRIVSLANALDENCNYVNPGLHASYIALESGGRVFEIKDNPNLGSATAGRFTITKFNGLNDFLEARIDLNFPVIRAINATTRGNYNHTFSKYSGLLGGDGFIRRLAETFGHEANHGIFAQRNPAQGTAIQRILNNRDAAIQALPRKGRYPLSPAVLQKIKAADEAIEPTERFAEEAERLINEELKASRGRSYHQPHGSGHAAKGGAFPGSVVKTERCGQ
jgi:hypothetical protein